MSNHLYIFSSGNVTARILMTVLAHESVARMWVNHNECLIRCGPTEFTRWFDAVFRTAPAELPIYLLVKSPGLAFERIYSPVLPGL